MMRRWLNRRERGLVRISTETSAVIFLLAVLVVAGITRIPKVLDWLSGQGSTMHSQEPTQDNLDEIMAEILGDPSGIGDFGLLFPFIQQALLENIYPHNRLLKNDLLGYGDLPDMSPNSIIIRGNNDKWRLVFSVSFQRFDFQNGQEETVVIVRVHPPRGRPQRQSFRLDEAGQVSLQEYLELLSHQVVGWDESQVSRYSINLSYSTRPLPGLPDQTEFFAEVGRLGIPGIGSAPFGVTTIFWDHNYFMDDDGSRVFSQRLRFTLPNSQSAGPPYLSYTVTLEGDEIIVHGDVTRLDSRYSARLFPFLAGLFANSHNG